MLSYKDLNIIYQGGNLSVANCKLISLEGCPQHITGEFYCHNNNKLMSLVGGPQHVNNSYICTNNNLTDLSGCASNIKQDLSFENNPRIISMVGIHKIIKSCNRIYFSSYNIIHGGIGLLLIGNLTTISADSVPFQIIRKYLGSGTKGMMECSKELTAKGYAPYAKL